MSVWKSDEKLLIFASLISPSKISLFEKQYQAFDTVFHQQMKHLKVRQKYSAARRIFNSPLGVLSDETLRLMLDILLPSLALVHFSACDVKVLNATLNVMEDANKRKRILLSLFELVCSYYELNQFRKINTGINAIVRRESCCILLKLPSVNGKIITFYER